MTAVSASDVWAVGTYIGSNGLYQTLVERWSGSSWSVIPSPNGSITSPRGAYAGAPGSNKLYGVTAISATDVWAVGGTAAGLTVTLHWNGSTWSLIPSPSDSAFDQLNAVAAVSSNDVMAVGYSNTSAYSTLAEHWNGTRWSIAPTPTESTANRMNFVAITAVPGTKTFLAVGVAGYFGALNGRTTTRSGNASRMGTQPGITGPTNDLLMERRDGTTWSVISVPSPVLATTGLTGIIAESPTDIWAVGNYLLPHLIYQTLIERYLPNAMGVVC